MAEKLPEHQNKPTKKKSNEVNSNNNNFISL